VCQVQHADKRDSVAKCQTKTIPNSLEPAWNETHELEPWQAGEGLEFIIYDQGLLNSKLEGKASLPSEYFAAGGFEGDVPIQGLRNAMLHVSVLPVDVSVNGSVPGVQLAADVPTNISAREQGPAQKLEISIVQAVGLKHLNFSGDKCFCVCSVQHAEKQAKPAKCETKQIQSLEPMWNETHVIEPWRPGEAVEFAIYDQGLLNARSEGRAILPADYFAQGGFEGDVPIDGLSHAHVHVRVLPAGVVMQQLEAPAAQVLTYAAPPAPAAEVTYAAPQAQPAQVEEAGQRVQVTIVQATGLKSLNMFGDNMYCTCHVQHADKRANPAKCETATVSKSLEPTWDETFVMGPWQPGEGLEFNIYDKGFLNSRAEGKAVLSSEYFACPGGFEGDVPINGLPNAMVHVRVTTLPDIQAEPQKLHIEVIQATGLKHLNFTGDNMSCLCSVLKADKTAKPVLFETKQVSKSLDPVWNERHELDPWYPTDGLEFTIYDKGLLKARTEGKASLPSDYLYPSGFEGDVPIEGLPNAMLHVRITPGGASTVGQQQASAPAVTYAAPAPPQRLKVTILSASGLKHLNFAGDKMYCRCLVQGSRNKPILCETKTVNKSLDPVWNETHDLEPWYVEDGLEFTIYDKGLVTSRKEGKASLPSKWFADGGFEGDVPIEGLPDALLHVRVLPDGPIQQQQQQLQTVPQQIQPLQVLPNQQQMRQQQVQQRLQVTIIHAAGLEHLNLTGDAPYCVCTVQRADKRTRPPSFQTKALKGTLDPVWNETHDIDPWMVGECLEFAVFDKGMLGSKQEGKVARLMSEQFFPNGFQGDLAIQGAKHATLHIRVLPVGSSVVANAFQPSASGHIQVGYTPLAGYGASGNLTAMHPPAQQYSYTPMIVPAQPSYAGFQSSPTRPVPMVLPTHPVSAGTRTPTHGGVIPGPQMFSQLDSNHDGMLDRSDFAAMQPSASYGMPFQQGVAMGAQPAWQAQKLPPGAQNLMASMTRVPPQGIPPALQVAVHPPRGPYVAPTAFGGQPNLSLVPAVMQNVSYVPPVMPGGPPGPTQSYSASYPPPSNYIIPSASYVPPAVHQVQVPRQQVSYVPPVQMYSGAQSRGASYVPAAVPSATPQPMPPYAITAGAQAGLSSLRPPTTAGSVGAHPPAFQGGANFSQPVAAQVAGRYAPTPGVPQPPMAQVYGRR
jgi:hypothetical protein